MSDETEGFKGQPPHDIFQEYMETIVGHPVYEGMPDSHYDDGRIQWEAPSNRAGGKFKDSHQRRRDWWARKASTLGINTHEGQWISRVAKAIHPTLTKPCKKCGRVMDIRYVYPGKALLSRVYKLPFVDPEFAASTIEDIFTLTRRLHEQYGDQVLAALPSILKLKGDHPGRTAPLDVWLQWLENDYVRQEPTSLSPGAMSNAPDRFDGFHSFNRCCRGVADTGRKESNLRSYTTDRRVFEYWASGDWIAADRLMGVLRRDFRDERCLNDHPGPCQADHIGPISLGFNHRPHFQLLCGACNSAKNNRMSFADVGWLRNRETKGEEVISWHSRRVWDLCKEKVANNENALRLSKVLRDNRHSYMHALSMVARGGHFGFLASLLELGYADSDVEFVGLRVENHVTEWDEIRHTPRATRYAVEQKARRSRIAFGELINYFAKTNRNAFVVQTNESEELLQLMQGVLSELKQHTAAIDGAIRDALRGDPAQLDGKFRQIHSEFAGFDFGCFAQARTMLQAHMDVVGEELARMWDDDRFTRELAAPEDDLTLV